MTYEEIENLLFCPETNNLVLDGDYYTEPFFAIVNHRIGDMFLFYTIDEADALIYGYVIIEPATQSVIKYNENIDKAIRLPNNDSGIERYKELYEQVHNFVFKNDLTIAQIEILKDYYELLQTTEYAFMFEVYNTFASEFLTWAKHQLSL